MYFREKLITFLLTCSLFYLLLQATWIHPLADNRIHKLKREKKKNADIISCEVQTKHDVIKNFWIQKEGKTTRMHLKCPSSHLYLSKIGSSLHLKEGLNDLSLWMDQGGEIRWIGSDFATYDYQKNTLECSEAFFTTYHNDHETFISPGILDQNRVTGLIKDLSVHLDSLPPSIEARELKATIKEVSL